jgi:hypothetical protein
MKVRRERAEVGGAQAGNPLRAGEEQDFMVQIAQEVYRVVLFAVFMLQTYVAGLIPIVGGSTPPSPGSPFWTHCSMNKISCLLPRSVNLPPYTPLLVCCCAHAAALDGQSHTHLSCQGT